MYHCSSCDSAFSETRNTPIAQLKTPIAVIVQVLSALTEGVGINAATRLYGVSKNSIYRWHIGKNLSSLPDFSIIIAAKEGLQAQLEAPCLPIPLGMSTLRMTG